MYVHFCCISGSIHWCTLLVLHIRLYMQECQIPRTTPCSGETSAESPQVPPSKLLLLVNFNNMIHCIRSKIKSLIGQMICPGKSFTIFIQMELHIRDQTRNNTTYQESSQNDKGSYRAWDLSQPCKHSRLRSLASEVAASASNCPESQTCSQTPSISQSTRLKY